MSEITPCEGTIVERGGRICVLAIMAPQSPPTIAPNMRGEGSCATRQSPTATSVAMIAIVHPTSDLRVLALMWWVVTCCIASRLVLVSLR